MMRFAFFLFMTLVLIGSDLAGQEPKDVPLSELQEENRRLKEKLERLRNSKKPEAKLPAEKTKEDSSGAESKSAAEISLGSLKDCGPIVVTIQVDGLPPSVNARKLLSRIESIMKEKKLPLATGKQESKSILRITVSGNASREFDLYGIYMGVEMLRPVQLVKGSQFLAIFWQVNSVALANTQQSTQTVEGYLVARVEQFIQDYERVNR